MLLAHPVCNQAVPACRALFAHPVCWSETPKPCRLRGRNMSLFPSQSRSRKAGMGYMAHLRVGPYGVLQPLPAVRHWLWDAVGRDPEGGICSAWSLVREGLRIKKRVEHRSAPPRKLYCTPGVRLGVTVVQSYVPCAYYACTLSVQLCLDSVQIVLSHPMCPYTLAHLVCKLYLHTQCASMNPATLLRLAVRKYAVLSFLDSFPQAGVCFMVHLRVNHHGVLQPLSLN